MSDQRIPPRPNPPQVAMVGFDHRVSDGHRGGIFLGAVDRHLQRPEG